MKKSIISGFIILALFFVGTTEISAQSKMVEIKLEKGEFFKKPEKNSDTDKPIPEPNRDVVAGCCIQVENTSNITLYVWFDGKCYGYVRPSKWGKVCSSFSGEIDMVITDSDGYRYYRDYGYCNGTYRFRF